MYQSSDPEVIFVGILLLIIVLLFLSLIIGAIVSLILENRAKSEKIPKKTSDSVPKKMPS